MRRSKGSKVGAGNVAVPQNTVAPAVTGTPTQGQTLTSSTGTWTNTPTGFAYQWYKGTNFAIPGANTNTYTLQSTDVGDNIYCQVTASNANGNGPAKASNVVGPIATAKPINTVAPTVSGTGAQGSTLTLSNGTWSNTPSGYTYTWLADGVVIGGATANTYVLTASEIGKTITGTVAATNAFGTATAVTTSNSIGPIVAGAPVNSVAPTISGTTTEGTTLTVSNVGTWSNSPTSYNYQWKRNGTNITSANASTYVTVAADDGTTITCAVAGVNAGGTGTAVDSNGIGPIVGSSVSAVTIAFPVSYVAGSPITSLDISNIVLSGAGNVAAGDYLILEWAPGASPTTNADGTYSTSGQAVNSLTHFISETEITTAEDGSGNMRFDLSSDPWVASSGTAGQPTGTGKIHAYIMRGDLVTMSPMSNALSFSISASVAKWTSTNGAFKASQVTLSPGNLQFQGSTGVGSWYGVAADRDTTSNHFVLEFTLDANATDANDQIGFGLLDSASTDLTPGRPGVVNALGFILQTHVVGTAYDLFRSNANNSGSSWTAANANQPGDIIRLYVDYTGATGTDSVTVKRYRASDNGGVERLIGTLSNQTFKAFKRAHAHMQSNVKATANFASTAGGFDLYG